ncbi:hypothetical protein FJ936_09150 [Mesorhizobium sp. B2-4-13]|uniref:hypothetical protein n=1 Tax=Mesorhizobium sp. B2-4-13 TaxID=2589936 RepID=UPI0011528FE8|nr:hypothetical protein [Mesorhizobium sp. B2-4-13]TPK85695.1 hypothetical protein FJ936_09150 [Mesorhizobium sp. B2-4-13]
MKTILGTVPLLNRVTGKFEDATLFRGAGQENLAHFETRWRPMLEMRRLEAEQQGLSLHDINAEDVHWDWGKKVLAAEEDPLILELFVLECGYSTQALMLVRKGGLKCLCRHPEDLTNQLIYVDFLATAPWNRPRLVAQPAYSGCGRILLAAAVSLSFDEEMKGRIGLHALPGAETYYRDKIRMTDLGPDEHYQNLRYFEVSTSAAMQMFATPGAGGEDA